jgi:hypothetical protein
MAMTKALSITLASKAFSTDFDTLPSAGQHYLIEYGFSQAMRDSQALGTAERVKKAVEAKALPEGTTSIEGLSAEALAPYNTWLATFLAERAEARFAAILGGSITFGGGGTRLTPEESIRRDYIDEILAGHAKSKGVTLPKKEGELAPLRAQVEAVYKAKIDAEVARRMKAAHGLADGLGDIFAGLAPAA